jgi:hypothetical protein
LAIHVGIVGHRPNRLPRDEAGLQALRGNIRTILVAAAAKPALLRAVTSLAEGADRIFAEEALALGYALYCPLPFKQAEFEKDFMAPAALEPESLEHFRALLEQARGGPGLTVVELDGARTDAPAAYAAAGEAVLDQSNILVGVWDGGEAAGRGGTAETLEEGLHRHIPLLWIDARAPEYWALLRAETGLVASHSPQQGPDQLEKTMARLVQSVIPR